MIVLAVEPDSQLAAKVRHVVSDLVKARLIVVRSVELAIGSLPNEVPDLVLLPALVSPAGEWRLVEALRSLPACAHVEILITPALDEDLAGAAPRGWRLWGSRRTTSRQSSDEQKAFAERIAFSLARARQNKEPAQTTHEPLVEAVQTEPVVLEPAIESEPTTLATTALALPEPVLQNSVESAPAVIHDRERNRRANPRFPATELQGLRDARLKSGPSVSVLDVSVGGALIETERRLQPESEAVLELVSSTNRADVPFRVVRSQAMIVGGALRYRGACQFSESLDLKDLLENPVQGYDAAAAPTRTAALDEVLDALQRQLPSLERDQLAELMSVLRSERPPSNDLEREAQRLLSIAVSQLPRENASSEPDAVEDPADRRRHIRVYGPFDGLRLGAIETPVTIRDLSEGGCFIDSLVEAKAGRRLSIGLLVPGEDWITATGEVVRGQPDFGYALRFVELPEETRASLARTVSARSGSRSGGKGDRMLAVAS